MTHRSPLVTLGVVAAFFLALLVTNFVIHPGGAETTGAPAAPTASATVAAGPAPSSTALPSPAATPETSAAATPPGPTDDDAFPHKATYAGRTEGREFAVAIAVLGDRAAAYVCDGRSREAWLRGTVDGDEVTLTSRNGYRIKAELDDDGRLEGRLSHAGRRWEFELRQAKPPAGIYRAKGSTTTIGWIRLPDGSLVGVATDARGSSEPAPDLPADGKVVVDGERLVGAPVDGDAEL